MKKMFLLAVMCANSFLVLASKGSDSNTIPSSQEFNEPYFFMVHKEEFKDQEELHAELLGCNIAYKIAQNTGDALTMKNIKKLRLELYRKIGGKDQFDKNVEEAMKSHGISYGLRKKSIKLGAMSVSVFLAAHYMKQYLLGYECIAPLRQADKKVAAAPSVFNISAMTSFVHPVYETAKHEIINPNIEQFNKTIMNVNTGLNMTLCFLGAYGIYKGIGMVFGDNDNNSDLMYCYDALVKHAASYKKDRTNYMHLGYMYYYVQKISSYVCSSRKMLYTNIVTDLFEGTQSADDQYETIVHRLSMVIR